MYKKIVLLALVSFLSISTIYATQYVKHVGLQAGNTYLYPDDFPGTLEQAIYSETVKDGDRIIVRNGIWHEHLNVNKSITLEGGLGGPTTLDGEGTGTVIKITASNVTILNFRIQNGNDGIRIRSSDNILTNNIITSNRDHGIYIASSSNNSLSNNAMTGNTHNFGVEGTVLPHFVQCIDESNTVNEKPIYYWVNHHNNQIPSDAGYVGIVNSTNVTVRDLTLRNNHQGALFAYTSNCTIEDVDASYNNVGITLKYSDRNLVSDSRTSNNYVGISLSFCNNNTVDGNVIENNQFWGLQSYHSNRTSFYHNNFIQASPELKSFIGSFNHTWDNGAEGNYWISYTGVDEDGDGIGDDPYEIDKENVDQYPLIEEWSPTRTINVTWSVWWMGIENVITTYNVTILSDHVVASYKFESIWDEKIGLITFNVTSNGSGFCNITIPRDRLDSPFELFINGTKTDFESTYNTTHYSLYFNYSLGKHKVKIVAYKMARAYGDVDGDGWVDMTDIGIACLNYGEHILNP